MQHCVYICTNPSFPGWVKVGRTKNPDERKERYNDSCPEKNFSLEPIIECASQPTAHILEQASIKALAQIFESNGEWIKCDPAQAIRAIHIQYDLITLARLPLATRNNEVNSILKEISFVEREEIGRYMCILGKILLNAGVTELIDLEAIENEKKTKVDKFLKLLPSFKDDIKFLRNEDKLHFHLPTIFHKWKNQIEIEENILVNELKISPYFLSNNDVVRINHKVSRCYTLSTNPDNHFPVDVRIELVKVFC